MALHERGDGRRQAMIEAAILSAIRQRGPLSMAQLVRLTVPSGELVPDEWSAAVLHLAAKHQVEGMAWRAGGVTVPGLRLPLFC